MRAAIIVLILATGLVFGQETSEPKQLTNAREVYQKELAAAQVEVTKRYIGRLERLFDDLKDKSDKKPALAVATELEAMKKTVGVTGSGDKAILGIWAWGSSGEEVTVTANGKFTSNKGFSGTWKYDPFKKKYRFEWNNNSNYEATLRAGDSPTMEVERVDKGYEGTGKSVLKKR